MHLFICPLRGRTILYCGNYQSVHLALGLPTVNMSDVNTGDVYFIVLLPFICFG